MTIHVVHYLDGTKDEFPPVDGYIDALMDGGVSWSGPTYLGGGPGPGGGGVVKFTWRFGDAKNRESSITVPLMRIHHIEERDLTQADYDGRRPA